MRRREPWGRAGESGTGVTGRVDRHKPEKEALGPAARSEPLRVGDQRAPGDLKKDSKGEICAVGMGETGSAVGQRDMPPQDRQEHR